MEPFRGILLLIGIGLIFIIFCYSRGWYPKPSRWFRRRAASATEGPDSERPGSEDQNTAPVESGTSAQPVKQTATPQLLGSSKVITVRIMPAQGGEFPAEELILALRSAGLRHGQFGIFHAHAPDDDERIRYSVASLVEPGSFDLTSLKESSYKGISVFAVLPAPEDGLRLFDDMVAKAREIAKAIDGCVTDEQGGAFSLQRERYMREDLIEHLRRHQVSNGQLQQTAAE